MRPLLSWRELNDKVKEELTVDEHDKLAKSLGPLFQGTLTGGSPELRADLPEITEVFSKRWVAVGLTVHGLNYQSARETAKWVARSSGNG